MMATWLREDEHTRPVTDINIQNLLDLVNKEFGGKYRLSEDVERRGWFRKKTYYYYSLYWNTLGDEYQCINFYTDDHFAYGIRADVIAAYFYGLLNGRKND